MSYDLHRKSDWRIDAEIQKMESYRVLTVLANVACVIGIITGIVTKTEGLIAGMVTVGGIVLVISIPAILWINDDLMDYREEKHSRTQAELEKYLKELRAT